MKSGFEKRYGTFGKLVKNERMSLKNVTILLRLIEVSSF